MALVDEAGDAFPRYWVENVFEALAPGEWYLDRPSGRLTYAPRPGERPDTTVVEIPVLPSLLRLEGEPEKDRFVEGLRFEGIAFEHAAVPAAEPAVQAAWTTPGTLVLRRARNVSIEEGRLAGFGGYAIEIGPGCRDVRVVGNELADIGAGGVKVDGADAAGDPRLRTTAVAVTDNHLLAIDRVLPSAIGVLVRHAADVRIAHNHIHDNLLHGDLRRLGLGLRAERDECHPHREERHPRRRPPLIATGLADDAAETADRPFLSDLNLFWDVSGAPVALGDGRGAGKGGLRKALTSPGSRPSASTATRSRPTRASWTSRAATCASARTRRPSPSASGRSTSRTAAPARAGGVTDDQAVRPARASAIVGSPST